MNPGSEIIAEGNIIVIGNAKGLIHAGCSGNRNCFVLANNLIPIQLRIADIITYIPKEIVEFKSKDKNKKQSVATIINDQIRISEI